MILPNFLIIGASKAATTSLYHHLAAHPEVFMSRVKEVNFFAYSPTGLGFPPEWEKDKHHQFPAKTIEEYAALFDDAIGCKATGEASPLYLDSPLAPEAIRKRLPDVRLIVSLRNPVDRILSDFKMRLRCGFSTDSFEEAFQPGKQLYELGFVSGLLGNYLDRFDRRQIKMLLFDDIVSAPASVMADVYRFLDVSDAFVPDLERRYNSAPDRRTKRTGSGLRGWAVRLKRRLLSGIKSGDKVTRDTPGLTSDDLAKYREHLAITYGEEIRRLEAMIGRDLSGWIPRA
ncbi:MAG: sulfotransferase [Opitutaceae bacterium]